MSRLENEFWDYDSAMLWNEVYQRVKNEASLKTLDEQFGVTEARKPENRHKNRYRDVCPYDHTRVVLKQGEDYINASYIHVVEARRKYILTQGPLEHTCGQFWQMVWEQKSKAIIMLNRVVEKGTVSSKAIIMLNRVVEKGTLKCHQYWPLGSNQGYEDEMLFDEVDLKVTVKGEHESNHYSVRYFDLEDTQSGETREVLHFHYTTWPDFGVPSCPTTFLNFLYAVRDSGALDLDVGPAIIHCSAGIGRSGTFCLVDSCLVMIERNHDLDCVDVRGMLIEMRSCRMGLIQTPDQLRFSYLAIIEGGKRILNKSDANSNVRDSTDGQLSNHRHKEDSPPPPPIRTSSLSPSREPPPLPPKKKDLMEEDDAEVERQLKELLDYDDEDDDDDGDDSEDDYMVMESPKVKEAVAAPEEERQSAYELRKRIREERKKSTQEKIKDMKDRQKKSEQWKKQRSYLQPICIGLGILIGGYLLYKYYWNN